MEAADRRSGRAGAWPAAASGRRGRSRGWGAPRHPAGPRLVVVLAAGLVACGSSDPAPTSTVEPLPASPTVTEAAPTPTSTRTPTQTPTTSDDPGGPDAAPTADGGGTSAPATPPVVSLAAGSGCTPGRTDGLPDGRWFGTIEGADTGSVVFDLACWFSGDAAARAAAEDGEESPPPNDYYVRDDNDLLRTIDVGASAEVVWLTSPSDPTSAVTTDYDDWRADEGARPFRPSVWLTVESDEVVAIEEQYVP